MRSSARPLSRWFHDGASMDVTLYDSLIEFRTPI